MTTYNFEIVPWKQVGLVFPSWVRANKLATLEKNMILRVIGKLPQADCTKIKGLLQDMFKP